MWHRKVAKNIRHTIKKAIFSGSDPKTLTWSFCVGIYIAFSPFIGLHFVMIIAATWLFKLNFALVFASTSINNPWTLIPFYSSGYVFGYWVIHNLLGLNPQFVIPLEKIFGGGTICLWSFLIGGNILGILAAIVSYPIMRPVFNKLIARKKVTQKNEKATLDVEKSDENYCEE